MSGGRKVEGKGEGYRRGQMNRRRQGWMEAGTWGVEVMVEEARWRRG